VVVHVADSTALRRGSTAWKVLHLLQFCHGRMRVHPPGALSAATVALELHGRWVSRTATLSLRQFAIMKFRFLPPACDEGL
jgi:hypothetical protein